MSRCVACNKVMSKKELISKKPNGEYEDMCRGCLSYVQEVLDSDSIKEEKEQCTTS